MQQFAGEKELINCTVLRLGHDRRKRTTHRVKAVFAYGLAIVIIWNVLSTANLLMVSQNNRRLRQALTSLDAKAVTLNDVVPFGWDTVYAFDAYLSKEEMTEIIGFKSGALRETVSKGMVSLAFVRGSSVVASVCGYADNLGYAISAPTTGIFPN